MRLDELIDALRSPDLDQRPFSFAADGSADGVLAQTEIRPCDGHPAAEWTLHLTNTGTADSPILNEIQALDLVFESAGDPLLHYARGGVCSMDDFQPLRRVFSPGATLRLQPGGGRSSSDFLPFFNLRLGPDCGVMLGIGWSGEWAAQFDRVDGGLRVRIGQAHTHLRLRPGESVRTPLVLVMPYEGDQHDGQNALRRLILGHYRPRPNGEPLELPLFLGNWGGTSAAMHLANVDACAAHDLPAGVYWIDAEWFGQGPWFHTVGDWRPKADLYPDGFAPISQRLREGGRELLAWFEPERVCVGTPWYDELRDWLLDVPEELRHYNWGRSQFEPEWVQWESRRNQIGEADRLYNLAIPAAREHLTRVMGDCIERFGLGWFRHDANIAPLEFWLAADAPDRQGITEIRWVEGLYAFWDGLLERFPHLKIDNCASGGRRIDLESLLRSTPLWRTDHPGDPIGRQCHTHGIAAWVPLNSTGGVNPAYDSDYLVRSTWSASLACGLFVRGDMAQAVGPGDDFPFGAAHRALSQLRDAQRYFLGDYYPLSCYSQAPDAWLAWQFHLPGTDEGLVQAFRRPLSPHAEARYTLRGLDPAGDYEVTDLDTGEMRRWGGAELLAAGLPIRTVQRPAAVVVTYRRVPAGAP
ncbi:MAG: alpha-galactosidase [Armatimonadetes bacterium]|nr:alpha-galactosidase [Armatimonadota bacterium]